MRRLLLLLLLLTLLPGVAGAADQVVTINEAGVSSKYKAGNLSNCNDASGWSGASNIQAAITASGASSTVYVCPGTYSGAMINATYNLSTTAASQALIGSGQGVTILDHTGMSGNNAFYVSPAGGGATIQDLTMQNIPTSKKGVYFDVAGTHYATDVTISSTYGQPFRTGTGADVVATRVSLIGPFSDIILVSGNSVTANYCRFLYLGSASYINTHAGTNVFNNCEFYGSQGVVIYQDGAATTTTINNGIEVANALSAAAYPFYKSAGGNFALNNTLLLNRGSLISQSYGSGTETPVDSLYRVPGIRSARYPAILSVSVDDNTNVATFTALADLATPYGMSVTWAISRPQLLSSANWDTVVSKILDGHDVAGHTMTHTNLTTSLTDVMQLKYTGNATGINLSITDTDSDGYVDRFQVTLTGQSDGSTSIDWDLTNALYKDVGTLVAEIDLKSFYSATLLTAAATSAASKTLEANAGEALSYDTYKALSVDETDFFRYELDDCKAYIETQVRAHSAALSSWTCDTFVYPGNNFNDTVIGYVKDVYMAARTDSTVSGNSKTLSDLYPFKLTGYFVNSTLFGSNETETRARTATLAEALGAIGAAAHIWTHQIGVNADCTASETPYVCCTGSGTGTCVTEAQWGYIFDELSRSSIGSSRVMSASDMAKHVRNVETGILPTGVDTLGDGTEWTRTLVDGLDLRLRGSSLARKAGDNTILSGTASVTDMAGRIITNAAGAVVVPYRSIGAYQWRSSGGGMLLMGVGP
ncbi:MAG: hypothetical protein PHY29_03050 [Syntrophales bacterium]|nr:hypothetical protein [Syntrophales bacterium]